MEEVEFEAGELDPGVAVADFAGAEIEDEGADAELGDGAVWGDATEHRTESCKQFAGSERFREVIVGADLETNHPIGLVPFCGQHHNGDVRAEAEAPEHLEAVDAGEHDVEDHGVDRLGGKPGEPRFAVGRCDDDDAVPREVLLDEGAETDVIVNQQDFGHGGGF